MKAETHKRTWRPHPLYTRDLWHDIAPVGVALMTAAGLAVACHLAGRDVSSAFEHVSIFHLVGLVTGIGLIHLLVTHAPTWFVRRRLSALSARRTGLERRIVRQRIPAAWPISASARRKMPCALRRDIHRFHRLTLAIARLETYRRSILSDPSDEA